MQKQRNLWKPGQSGNPLGRPQGSRQKVTELVLRDMARSWGKDGASVLQRLVTEDPATYARLAFSVIPKDVAVSLEQKLPANMAPGEWMLLRQIVEVIEANVPVDHAEQREDILRVMGEALAAHFAKQV